MEVQHEGSTIVATPVTDGWRVQYEGRTIESRFLEYAIAEAVGIDAKDAIAFATRILQEHIKTTPTDTPDTADSDDPGTT